MIRFWLAAGAQAALVAVGVESVQERDVSSVALVLVAMACMTAFVTLSRPWDQE